MKQVIALSLIVRNTGQIEGLPEHRKIAGFDGYLFFENGRIFSTLNGVRELMGATDRYGYDKISLTGNDKKVKHTTRHRLIARAFWGESEMDVNHKDLNKKNCALSNLEYVTRRENQCHRRLAEGHNVGVSWGKKEGKWRAYIQKEKVWEHLGFFTDKKAAKQAYINRSNELGIVNKYAESN